MLSPGYLHTVLVAFFAYPLASRMSSQLLKTILCSISHQEYLYTVYVTVILKKKILKIYETGSGNR